MDIQNPKLGSKIIQNVAHPKWGSILFISVKRGFSTFMWIYKIIKLLINLKLSLNIPQTGKLYERVN